jgi:hypothetical protein
LWCCEGRRSLIKLELALNILSRYSGLKDLIRSGLLSYSRNGGLSSSTSLDPGMGLSDIVFLYSKLKKKYSKLKKVINKEVSKVL